MGISSYSRTPASNTAINGINIAEGCAPSGINDAIRQMMADIASGVVPPQLPTATGSANAIVVAISPAYTATALGDAFTFLPASNNTGPATINYGGGAVSIKKWGSIALAANDIVSGIPADIIFDGTNAILKNPQTYTQGADIASASTLNLDAATGDYLNVTGTTTITAITLTQGKQRTVQFSGILTLTNGASLINSSGANITTAAGDVAIFRGEASGVVRMIGYMRANGQALVSSSSTQQVSLLATKVAAASSSLDFTSVISSSYSKYILVIKQLLNSASASIGLKISTDNGSTWTQAMYGQGAAIHPATTTSPSYSSINNVTPAIISDVQALAFSGEASFMCDGGLGILWESSTSPQAGGADIRKVNLNSASATVVNAIQLLPSSGNFTSGTVYLYGIKNT